MLRNEAIALSERQRKATWQQLCGPRLCTNIQMHTFHPVLSGQVHSPPLGPKSDKSTHMGAKNTQSHSCPKTHTASHTAMACLSQTLGCTWHKQISLLQTFTYSETFRHTDLACLTPRVTLSVFICADFLRHMHTQRDTHPTVHSPYTPSRTHYCQPQGTVLSVVKCKQKHQFSCTDSYMLLHSHTH